MIRQAKFYLHFEGTPEFTQKITCDVTQPLFVVVEKFVSDYNKRHGSVRTLELDSLLVKKDGTPSISLSYPVNHVINDEDDVYIVQEEKELTCGRPGCGKKYFERDNIDNACQFHPGPPIFHEGYKGWKCCGKKTVDFEQYLQFVGCAFGRHEPKETAPKTSTFAKITNAPTNAVTTTVKTVSTEGGKEVYDAGAFPIPAAAPTKKPLPEPEPEPETVTKPESTEVPDPPDAIIPVGAPCTHQGCKATYTDDNSRTEECLYHPGKPIFHEGSKGWDCCKKFTLLFDEFWEQEGCTYGLHKFIPEQKPVTVDVRHDYYQQGDFIVVTFYTKKCDPSSTITFTPATVSVNLKLANGDVFNNVFRLSGGKRLDPDTAKYSILSTKVEIKFRKATEGDWLKQLFN